MEKNKTITELISELEYKEKIIEKALNDYKGKKIAVNIITQCSVNSTTYIIALDWTYILGNNERQYFFISEYPFESLAGTNLSLDIDNIEEVEYKENTLRIWFEDGLKLDLSTHKE